MPKRVAERVLVLDAHVRHALAIVRSLGKREIPVVMASPHRRFPAKYSRYGEASVLLDSSSADALSQLLAVIDEYEVDVILAAALPGNELLCRHRRVLEPRVKAPFNDISTFELLSNKASTAQLADRLGVARPTTRTVVSSDEVDDIVREIGFPMVFKSPVDQGTVRFPRDRRELQQLVNGFGRDNSSLVARGIYPMVQEYIAGVGHGFYGLADHGDLRAYFMHERLHEVPPSGGPSAMAMSYRDHALKELGERFFAATSWHGAAMVEFKRGADGRYYLIEVNPKFWGSLDLSVFAGVDFPFLLYELLTGQRVGHVAGAYRDGAIFRWLTMDLAYAVATGRIRSYMRAFADDRIADDFVLGDPLPLVALFANGVQRNWSPVGRPVTSSS